MHHVKNYFFILVLKFLIDILQFERNIEMVLFKNVKRLLRRPQWNTNYDYEIVKIGHYIY